MGCYDCKFYEEESSECLATSFKQSKYMACGGIEPKVINSNYTAPKKKYKRKRKAKNGI